MSRYFDKVKRIKKDIKLPQRSTEYSAGYDFYAIEDITIEPSNRVKIALSRSDILLLIVLIVGSILSIHSWMLSTTFTFLIIVLLVVNITVYNDQPILVKTGVKAKMQDDEVLYLYNRSSNPKKGLILANGVGVIDADYFENTDNDGEIGFPFYNVSDEPITIHKGDKLGQAVFQTYLRADNDNATGKRVGGYGSTGN